MTSNQAYANNDPNHLDFQETLAKGLILVDSYLNHTPNNSDHRRVILGTKAAIVGAILSNILTMT